MTLSEKIMALTKASDFLWISLCNCLDEDAPTGMSWQCIGINDDMNTEDPSEVFNGHGATPDEAVDDALGQVAFLSHDVDGGDAA